MSSKEINLSRIVADVAKKGPDMSRGMRTMMQRKAEFSSELEAQLTGMCLDPVSRAYLENRLDNAWSGAKFDYYDSEVTGEVIIGAGFHAAVYAATRVQMGFPKPLVVERNERVGGVFAEPGGPAFFLNSRNRPGGIGLGGDSGANLNYLPGAPIQSANLSTGDYQTNEEMALVIRLTLAQYAKVLVGFKVAAVDNRSNGFELSGERYAKIRASRIIDARGLGDPRDANTANGKNILTFPQFMQRVGSTMWPLKGIRRAAVIGAGDSARCAIEALLGIGPQTPMSAVALDTVERIDAYGRMPSTKENWCSEERGRYNKIGRFLKPDRFGIRRLNVFPTSRPTPIAIPGSALIEGRAYDLIVMATGNQETYIPGLPDRDEMNNYTAGGVTCARRGSSPDGQIYRVGPHARLPFSLTERAAGVNEFDNNAVSMFRLASKTAAIAATLPTIRMPF